VCSNQSTIGACARSVGRTQPIPFLIMHTLLSDGEVEGHNSDDAHTESTRSFREDVQSGAAQAVEAGMDQVRMEGLSPRSVSGAPDDEWPIIDANAGLLAAALRLEVVKTRLTDRKQEDSCHAPLTVYAVTWNLNGKVRNLTRTTFFTLFSFLLATLGKSAVHLTNFRTVSKFLSKFSEALSELRSSSNDVCHYQVDLGNAVICIQVLIF
jgi:hypothetical protein